MHESLCDDIFDALALADKTLNLLPPLPPNFKPVYMRVLKAIRRLREENRFVRVSDINTELGGKLPNTTKLVNELVVLGVVSKQKMETDRRTVMVEATPVGEKYIYDYIEKYDLKMKREFEKIGVRQCNVMIQTIEKIYAAVKKTYL